MLPVQILLLLTVNTALGANYHIGESRGNCENGKKITSLSECKQAFRELGLKEGNSWERTWIETQDYGVPGGCSNKHTTCCGELHYNANINEPSERWDLAPVCKGVAPTVRPTPPPTPLPTPSPTDPNLWLAGTTTTGFGGYFKSTLAEAISRCTDPTNPDYVASCEYILEHGCDSDIFAAVGGDLKEDDGSTVSQPHGVKIVDGVVTDSNGRQGYDDVHAWRIRTASELSDLVVYPQNGWDSVGDTEINDAPHCVLKKPISEDVPTESPTAVPTRVPTRGPTSTPTALPTSRPSMSPTSYPTASPTTQPSKSPTRFPTETPTKAVECCTDDNVICKACDFESTVELYCDFFGEPLPGCCSYLETREACMESHFLGCYWGRPIGDTEESEPSCNYLQTEPLDLLIDIHTATHKLFPKEDECDDPPPTVAPTFVFVAPGRMNNWKTAGKIQCRDYSDDTIEHAVRCVKDEDTAGWRSNHSQCGIWAESDIWGDCLTTDYTAAALHCYEQGARLPTLAEVAHQCTHGSGCGYDNFLIWTSTPCDPDL